MYRAEIIANRSVREDLVEALEAAVDDFMYTIIPAVQGRGKTDRKLGTVIWPEVNCILIAYIEDAAVEIVRQTVSAIKERFPGEGIKLFMIPDCQV